MVSRFITSFLYLCTFLCAADASLEYSRYLAQIFQSYGNGDTITFEGLEHLMYNLGLGQIEFEPTHTIEEHWPQNYNHTKPIPDVDAVRHYFENQTQGLPWRNGTDDDSAIDIQLSKGFVIDPNSNHTKSMQMENKTNIVEFRNMHDPKHRHPRENGVTVDGSLPPTTSKCLTPRSLLSLLVDHEDLHKHKLYRSVINSVDGLVHNYEEEYTMFINSVRITPKAFMKLCPALLTQLIDSSVCVRRAPQQHSEHDEKDKTWNAWIYASVTMFVLSACGLLGILLVPLMKSVAYQEILKFLVAIAVGTLSGDALMHLLPHALFKKEMGEQELGTENSSTQHTHNNEAALLCGCAFMAALFMYTLENVIPLLKGGQGGHGHSHGHSHDQPIHKLGPTEVQPAVELNIMLQEEKLDKKTPQRPLTPVAFMVIIGDGLHNLTDGMAIGAAFASDPVTGLATAFAVLCHELPHELGDFALLLQTGVSLRRAVYYNLISSVLSFVGMSIGLFIAGIGDTMTQWIYAATAGSFLYIAFADLVPTMSVAHNPELVTDVKTIFLQILGISLGGGIMLLIALHEHDLERLLRNL